MGLEVTIIAWRKGTKSFEVYNVASENWITVDEVADEIVRATWS